MPEPLPSDLVLEPKPWGVWATLGLSVVVLSIFVLIQLLILSVITFIELIGNPGIPTYIMVQELSSNGLVIATISLIAHPLCIGCILWLTQLRQSIPLKNYLALRRPSGRIFIEWCLIAIIVSVSIDLFKLLLDRPIVPNFVYHLYETAYFLPVLFLAVVISAPIFEELLFRGFMFRGMVYSKVGSWGAIVLSALCWALIHLQYGWVDLIAIFIFGIFLGIAKLRTQSIYVPIAMHGLNNLLALLQVSLTNGIQGS